MRTETNPRYVQKLEATAGVACLVLGLIAPLLGGLLTGIEWLLGRGQHPWIHVTGTAFFIVGIPLILIAGFCLDWAEKKPQRTVTMNKRFSAIDGSGD